VWPLITNRLGIVDPKLRELQIRARSRGEVRDRPSLFRQRCSSTSFQNPIQ